MRPFIHDAAPLESAVPGLVPVRKEALDDSAHDLCRTSLPQLGPAALRDAMAALPADEAAQALRSGLVPLARRRRQPQFAAADPALLRRPSAAMAIAALATPDDLRRATEEVHGRAFAIAASQALARRAPTLSAHHRVTAAQAVALALWGLATLLGLVFASAVTVVVLNVVCAVFFLAVSALRLTVLYCRSSAQEPARRDPPALPDRDLPVYTVLVPLFREAAILPHLVAALIDLDYPALCIKRTKLPKLPSSALFQRRADKCIKKATLSLCWRGTHTSQSHWT